MKEASDSKNSKTRENQTSKAPERNQTKSGSDSDNWRSKIPRKPEK